MNRLLSGLIILVLVASCSSSESAGTSTTEGTGDLPLDSAEYAEQYVARLGQCIVDGGGELEETGRFGFTALPGPGMSDAQMARLMEDCQSLSGPRPVPPTDPDTATQIYEWYLEAYQCLIDEGYSPVAPPSLDVFIDQFAAGTGGDWFPYMGLAERFSSPEEEARVRETCPEIPQ